CMEYLAFSRPDLINKVHNDYFLAGADAVETNTFGANAIKLAEYGLENKVFEVNKKNAELARDSANRYYSPKHTRYVVGTMGPTGRLPSSNDPALGGITYSELKKVFKEQALGLIKGSADALLIETSQDLLEVKAAVGGAKEAMLEAGVSLPVMAQITLNNNGRMLLGTSVFAATASLYHLGVNVIGMNCGAGPLEMEHALGVLSERCPVYVSFLPNAGLPREENGKTVFPLTPDEMARVMSDFLSKYRLDVIGGCCGTGPEHIKAMREIVGRQKRSFNGTTRIFASFYEGYDVDDMPKPVIAGERVNTQGSKKVKELLLSNEYDGIIEIGRAEERKGAAILDVCAVLTERNTEKEDAVYIFKRLAESVKSALMIDSTDTGVIEAAAASYPGTCFVNSVNFEDGGTKAGKVFGIAKEFGSFVIALVIDEKGMAKTLEHKMLVAERIYELGVNKYGLMPHQLVFDMLTFSLGSGEAEYADSAVSTFDGIRKLKEKHPGVLTTLGVSNVSFGFPKQSRKIMNAVFLHHAVLAGLDIAIVNPEHYLEYERIDIREREICENVIFNKVPAAVGDLLEYFGSKQDVDTAEKRKDDALPLDEKLRNCVINRESAGLPGLLNEELKTRRAEDIINGTLLAAMREVGEKLDSGELVLPYVLQSAEVMRRALLYLKDFLPKERAVTKGTIVLATVFGDVHDIGKNLVKMILENNGYTVIDLGKQVSVERIVEETEKNKADAVGLSALLVSTARGMKSCVKAFAERGWKIPILIGGAPINENFAREISILDDKNVYKGGIYYARDAFVGLRLAEELLNNGGKKAFPEKSAPVVQPQKIVPAGLPDKKVELDKYLIANLKKGSVLPSVEKIPVPPFYGVRTVNNISIDEVFASLDKNSLFSLGWGTKHKDKGIANHLTGGEFEKILDDLKNESITKNWFTLKAVYGYFGAKSAGSKLNVFGRDGKVIESFDFAHSVTGKKSIADHFESGTLDLAAFQAVTVGDKITRVLEILEQDGEYSKFYFLHGLSVYLAEALAEYMNSLIRKELKIKNGSGKRYSPGYALWKNLADQEKIFRLLDVEKSIGVKLTAAYQMVPEQSTTAIVLYHKGAEY
ncbi:MAG: homocysteine S-methyltransferase family protein, partial [Candidatus Omnitrophica bacterium]|nr:homocysteine S-methyltransferase family protein [Candidatus Omnitrophota bacterium]